MAILAWPLAEDCCLELAGQVSGLYHYSESESKTNQSYMARIA